jgi:hypothetical protein
VEVIVRMHMMELSFSGIYVAVATVTRFRVPEALFGDCRKDRENLDSSDIWAHNLVKMY